MNIHKLILIIIVLTILSGCINESTKLHRTVNEIIGDISYVEAFGSPPNENTNEVLRLQTHLKYVEQLLRNKDVSNLSREQQENRLKMLDLLKEYWTAGVFPKNYDYPNKRIPCFIDKNGNICAVGYLIEQSAGKQTAEEINSKFKYKYLLAMNDPQVDNWVYSSGLTKLECAMIQPQYEPVQTENYISPEYGISSSIIIGLNLSLSTINGIQIAKGANNKIISIAGLISGAGQITLGALNYPEEQTTFNESYINPAQRNLSFINIGLGTGTMLISSWNLFTNRKPKNQTVSWNVYSFPTPGNNTGVGFSYSKRF